MATCTLTPHDESAPPDTLQAIDEMQQGIAQAGAIFHVLRHLNPKDPPDNTAICNLAWLGNDLLENVQAWSEELNKRMTAEDDADVANDPRI